MSIDYSKIIAIYKDGMELFRLYEGSNMLWEKPKYRRFYIYLQTEHELQSFISNILTSNADEAIIKSVDQFNNTIQIDSLGGYLIEIYADSKFNQSISAEEYTSVDTFVLSRDHTENEISTHIGRATEIAYTNSYLLDIDENIVLIVNGYTSASYTTILNYDSGVAYIFNINCSSANETTNTYAPCLVEKNVSDGKIFFFKNTAYPISSANWICSAGIFHYNKNNMRIQRLKSSGYYNTTKDAPGGFYIYTSMYPDLDRCYWNNETNTLTEIPY